MQFEGSSAPEIRVEVSFTFDPRSDTSVASPLLVLGGLSTPLGVGTLGSNEDNKWVDITEDVSGINIKAGQGGGDPTTSISPGEAKITIDNASGWYDPTNPQSPWYTPGSGSQVRPMRHVRIKALFRSITYGLFRGYIEEIDLDFGAKPTVSFDCVDILASFGAYTPLELTEFDNAIWANDGTGHRIQRVADSIGWPAVLRDLDTGVTTMPSTKLEGTGLELAAQAVKAECGLLFVDGYGVLRFFDRHKLFQRTRSIQVQATLADDGDFPEYSDLGTVYGVSQVFNMVTVQRATPFGPAHIQDPPEGYTQPADPDTPPAVMVQDTASIDRYGPRTLSVDSLQLTSQNEAQTLAEDLLQRYREPQLRVNSVTVELLSQPEQADQILPLGLWDRILTKRTYGENIEFSQETIISGYTIDVSEDAWTVDFDTQPVRFSSGEQNNATFILGVSQLGSAAVTF